MTLAPSRLYGDALSSGTAGRLSVRYADGRRRKPNIDRWVGPADRVDESLLERCVHPTLDVGCGPGRLVSRLLGGGGVALGVDVARRAVSLTRLAGAPALQRSVFDPLPFEGQWQTVLLADGNIGIGGNPVRLLRRCRELLSPTGTILVELEPPGAETSAVTIRLETDEEHSGWFAWAHVAADAIDVEVRDAGLRVTDRWTMNNRWFAGLSR